MLERADPGPVWVVLPTYNERDNLEPLVGAVRSELAEAVADHTILVVDDSSPDGTGEVADRLAREDPHVRVLHRPRKEGLGQAYLAGFDVALREGAALVLEMDADFSHDPSYLPQMIEAAAEADLVLGSRYVTGGGIRNWGRLRTFVSRGGCWYARTVLGLPVRDLTGGFKCFRREVLEALDLSRIRSQGYAFQVELTYRALELGFRVREIPIVFTDRRVGQSKMSRRIVLEAMWMIPILRTQRVPTRKASSNEVTPV
ncbi:MAG: polyprenol monophosphomannose synthase [Solirubrobacterales bacterium]